MSKEIMVLSGHGIDLRVKNGGLIIKSGFPLTENIQESHISKGLNEIEHIVIIAQSGSLTIEAVKWLIAQNIALSILDEYGNHVTDFMPENHISGITKRRQATANNSLNLKISAWLLSGKFSKQRETLNYIRDVCHKASWWNTDRDYRIDQALALSLDREKDLPNCLNVDSQRMLEAQAAASYWHCFEGMPLNWVNLKKVPVNWFGMGNRTSPKSGGPRKAIDPFNACLNYCYAVLETRVRNTCIINGIDPDFGVLHVDHSSRTSLVFDLMEPFRPKVDLLLFEWILSRKLDPKGFFETREGVCKLGQTIISQIIPLMKGLDKDITGVVKEFAGFFKNKIVRQSPEEFKQTHNSKIAIKSKIKLPKHKQVKILFPKSVVKVAKKNKIPKKTLDETKCLDCGQTFNPTTSEQKFCCRGHSVRFHQRKLREYRIVNALCQDCGSPLPKQTAAETGNKKSTYCEKCKEYRRKQYEKKKANSC